MFDLVINFKQLGWNWVLYPESLNAKYCTGGCDYHHTRDTMRGRIVAHAANFLSDDQTKSCCAPKKLLPISLIYREEGNSVAVSQFEDMIISGCRCV